MQVVAAAMSAEDDLEMSPQSTPSSVSPFDLGSPAFGTDLNSEAGLLESRVDFISSSIVTIVL